MDQLSFILNLRLFSSITNTKKDLKSKETAKEGKSKAAKKGETTRLYQSLTTND